MKSSDTTVVLASASPRRRELLEQIGISYVCHPAKGEEVITEGTPDVIVQKLAYQKASEVAVQYPDAIILGADTVVSCDGEILGKPSSRTEAKRMIGKLQGRSHQVFTGVCLLKTIQGKVVSEITFADETVVEMYAMNQEEIEAYTESGECDDKAGAYGIQGKCAAFIKGITGDYYNVVGLPVSRVYQNLKKLEDA